MKGTRFGVVTGVMTVLTALALFRVTFQGLVPPLDANDLQNQPGDYLQAAAHQAIHWRPFSNSAFAEARRSSKPILLVIGTPWSRLARFVDRQCFSDGSVANLVNHDFIPIRVDGSENPTWLASFLPISRLRTAFNTGFQAWVLDNHGRLLRLVGATKNKQFLDNGVTTAIDLQLLLDIGMFRQELRDAEDVFSDDALREIIPPMPANQHREVAQLQEDIANSVPLFDLFSQALSVEADPKDGGFPEGPIDSRTGAYFEGTISELRPLAWRFLLRTGQHDALQRCLDPYLTSRSVDIVHGGFFTLRMLGEHPSVDVDEVATGNAMMAQTLAEASLSEQNPIYRTIAERTFDLLVDQMRQDDLFAGCIKGDELPTERSPVYSFSPLRLRSVFSSSERNWVQNNLALNVGDNGQRIPYPISMSVYEDPQLEPVLQRMRDATATPPALAGTGFLDVNGTTAACLLRCARLWGDRERLNEVLDTVSALENFRFESNDVVHVQGTTSPGTYLGDYLAYSDAALQDYLATGHVMSFQNGLGVLSRAIDFYKTADQGVFIMGNPVQDPLLPIDTSQPEVSDSTREACMAQLIRLTCDYGRMIGPNKIGSQLLATASAAVSRVSDCSAAIALANGQLTADLLSGALSAPQLTASFSPRLAGIFVASASFVDSQCAFAVGPNAQTLADQLARARPNRLVAAAVGPVREDLQSRKSGIYVVAGSVVAGPYSVAQAEAVMPAALQIGINAGG